MPIACSGTRNRDELVTSTVHTTGGHIEAILLAIKALALQRRCYRLALFLAETFGVISDFGSRLLTVILPVP
jgi:hypothetical protein